MECGILQIINKFNGYIVLINEEYNKPFNIKTFRAKLCKEF